MLLQLYSACVESVQFFTNDFNSVAGKRYIENPNVAFLHKPKTKTKNYGGNKEKGTLNAKGGG